MPCCRGPGLQQSSFELTLLDDEASQEAAAGVAQCKVCSALARHLWEGLTGWVNRKRQVPNKRRIEAFANDLCEYEVGAGLLGWWALGWWVCLGRHWMAGSNVLQCRSAGAGRWSCPDGPACLLACCFTAALLVPCVMIMPVQVPNEVLKGWVLLRAKVQQAQGLPFAAEGQTQEFYMLRWGWPVAGMAGIPVLD